jgi:hypothetical protein
MRLPRFSIANLLALIAILAVALAALRSPSYLWANVTFSLALCAVVVAAINVVYGRGASRAYWLGFVLCGGVYLAVCSLPGLRESVCTRLATEPVFDLLYPHLSPSSVGTSTVAVVAPTTGGPVTVRYLVSPYNPTYSPANVAVPPPPPSTPPWSAWTKPDRTVSVGFPIGSVQLSSSEAFRQIGHSMCALLVAVLGATFARYRYHATLPMSQGARSE